MNISAYETKEITYKDNLAITFLYNNLFGRILLHILIGRSVSKFVGFLMERPISRLFIKGFINKNNINMEEYKDMKYKSFNDFFTREIIDKYRPFPNEGWDLAAPCDGKLTAYPITDNSIFHVKDSIYNLEDLLQDKDLAEEFLNGICLIFRLTPDDYHRYSYIDKGQILSQKKIKGVLHTVRPISHLRYKIYKQNSREYTVMKTEKFGTVIQMEVGALFVGRITNNKVEGTFKRGEEKGMFEFGGSTIVMLFQKDSVSISDSIYKNTQQGNETIVRMGYKIGKRLC